MQIAIWLYIHFQEKPMSLKKVTLASLILLGLTACGSGGGSETSANQDTSQAAEQQAQADKLAAEQAEKERLAKEEAERLAAEQAEKERLAKEEAERLAAEQAEKERLAKEEAERLAAEQAEQERLAKEQSIKLAELESRALAIGLDANTSKNFANEHLTTPEEDLQDSLSAVAEKQIEILKTQAIKSGLNQELARYITSMYFNPPYINVGIISSIKSQFDRGIKLSEIAQRIGLNSDDELSFSVRYLGDRDLEEIENTLNELIQKAKELGYTDEKSKSLAISYSTASDLETSVIREAKGIYEDYPIGLTQGSEDVSSGTTFYPGGGMLNRVTTTRQDIYNQKYSIVVANYSHMDGTYNGIPVYETKYNVETRGLHTNVNNIPAEGNATYNGKAFGRAKDIGNLTYTVDFNSTIGSGTVDGLDIGRVTLQSTSIDQNRLSGQASTESFTNGSYNLSFFGPKAEEIGGQMNITGDTYDNYGLAGSRGEIQK